MLVCMDEYVSLKIERLEIAKLKPHAKNPRNHPAKGSPEWDLLTKSLEHDYFDPIVFNKRNGCLVSGHLRTKVLREAGTKFVDCVVVDYDENTHVARMIAANKSIGENNDELLTQLVEELKVSDVSMDLTGFTLEELDEELGTNFTTPDVPDNNEVPDAPLVPVSEAGNLYEIVSADGKRTHRVLCGDSTDVANWKRLLDGRKIDLVWTDPPYGVSYVGKTKEALTIQNDSLDQAQLTEFLRKCFKVLDENTKQGGAWYVASPAGPLFAAFGLALSELSIWKHTLVWKKHHFVMGRCDYHYKHEAIFYGWKEGSAHTWNGGRDKDTILEFDRPMKNTEHPTMKPVELVKYCILNSSKIGDTVADAFTGSGTTLIACEEANRNFVGTELDTKYCDVILSRFARLFPGSKITSGGKDVTNQYVTPATKRV